MELAKKAMFCAKFASKLAEVGRLEFTLVDQTVRRFVRPDNYSSSKVKTASMQMHVKEAENKRVSRFARLQSFALRACSNAKGLWRSRAGRRP